MRCRCAVDKRSEHNTKVTNEVSMEVVWHGAGLHQIEGSKGGVFNMCCLILIICASCCNRGLTSEFKTYTSALPCPPLRHAVRRV